jgi:hypothetical protein
VHPIIHAHSFPSIACLRAGLCLHVSLSLSPSAMPAPAPATVPPDVASQASTHAARIKLPSYAEQAHVMHALWTLCRYLCTGLFPSHTPTQSQRCSDTAAVVRCGPSHRVVSCPPASPALCHQRRCRATCRCHNTMTTTCRYPHSRLLVCARRIPEPMQRPSPFCLD